MKLVETKYKTDEMLDSMIQLSRSKYYQDIKHLSFECLVDYIMVKFSFGRQAGHTTTIINLLNKSDGKYLIVVPNEHMKRIYFERIKEIKYTLSGKTVLDYHIVSINPTQRYFEGRESLSYENIIFDSCGDNSKIREFLFNFNYFQRKLLRSIVCVN